MPRGSLVTYFPFAFPKMFPSHRFIQLKNCQTFKDNAKFVITKIRLNLATIKFQGCGNGLRNKETIERQQRQTTRASTITDSVPVIVSGTDSNRIVGGNETRTKGRNEREFHAKMPHGKGFRENSRCAERRVPAI